MTMASLVPSIQTNSLHDNDDGQPPSSPDHTDNDAQFANPKRKPAPVAAVVKVQSVERHYYTKNKLFEQSLDIYRPASSTTNATVNVTTNVTTNATITHAATNNNDNDHNTPIVALVVGSAWLGHRSFVYSGTSWWNSSGPKAVAELGYVCVCIRHRGSFMKSLSILTMAFVAITIALLAVLLNVMMVDNNNDSFWISLLEKTTFLLGDNSSFNFVGQQHHSQYKVVMGGFVLAFITGLFLIELGDKGSAMFEDMQNDVMDALSWLNDNEERLHLTGSTAVVDDDDDDDDNDDDDEISSSSSPSSSSKQRKKRGAFVFGGYSSGGHVAATVTQQPHLWTDRNLPPPHVHCDSILYISPVLSTKSYRDVKMGVLQLEKEKMVSSRSSSAVMTSFSSDDGSLSTTTTTTPTTTPVASRQSSSVSEASSSEASSSSSFNTPTWLTDRVVRAVFGNDVDVGNNVGTTSTTIPSPIHNYQKSPNVPHIFLGCEHEMFGLNWLDTFFCAEEYCELLKNAHDGNNDAVDSMGMETKNGSSVSSGGRGSSDGMRNGRGSSRYTAVKSDHWNILGSVELRDALRKEMEWIELECCDRRSD